MTSVNKLAKLNLGFIIFNISWMSTIITHSYRLHTNKTTKLLYLVDSLHYSYWTTLNQFTTDGCKDQCVIYTFWKRLSCFTIFFAVSQISQLSIKDILCSRQLNAWFLWITKREKIVQSYSELLRVCTSIR